MNIALLTRLDSADIRIWSGTIYHIYQKLKEKHNVKVIGADVLRQLTLFSKPNFPAETFIPSDRYVKNMGRLLSERINALECDLLFFGDLLLCPSEIHIPFVLFSDMTYEQVKIHYRKSDERDIDRCIKLEKFSLDRATKIIYTSEWLKQKAIEFYNINSQKIEIVEMGANIPTPQNYSININLDVCHLVFIGVDWERKGGDKALQTFKILKDEGFPCTLTVIGSIPEDDLIDDNDLTIIPFLDKSKKTDLKKLCDILSESHFLVLPTRFDAFGIVFCEASAYALPSITANVGGVGQAVIDGKNGFLLSADAKPQDYAEKIKMAFNDKESYIKLRQSSRKEFEMRLNWEVWGERVNKIFEDAVAEYKNPNFN